MYKGQKLEKSHYLEQYDDLGTLRYKFQEENLYNFLRDGATLVANGIVNEPSVDVFSQEIAQFTGCHIFSSLYIAFNTQRSFKSHWDSRDILRFKCRVKNVGLFTPQHLKIRYLCIAVKICQNTIRI